LSTVILDQIVFNAPLEMFTERLRIQNKPALIEEFAGLLQEAKTIARPKVIFKAAEITATGDDYVAIAGQTFYSQTLKETLVNLKRVFPAIATCGRELAEWADGIDGVYTAFCAQVICEAAMGWAQDYFAHYVARHYQTKEIAYILPGTYDWPLVEQEKLFSLLNAAAAIGVELTASGTMRPIKTVSAVYYEK